MTEEIFELLEKQNLNMEWKYYFENTKIANKDV